VSRLRALAPWELGLLVAVAAWGLGPALVLVAHAAGANETLTGADGFLAGDQLQYLAWARDAGESGLAANLFQLDSNGHVFLHPMFSPTGWASAAGLGLTVAYWAWKPVAVLVLFAGVLVWGRRLLPDAPGRRAAAALLALFYFSPLAALLLWADAGSDASRNDLFTAAGEVFAAGSLWGYLQTAIAIGLMPTFLLAVERLLDPQRRAPGRGEAWYAGWAAAQGLIVAWLHPWQGVTLLLVVAGLAAWPGRELRQRLVLLVALAGIAVPLAYYWALARVDTAWELAERANQIGRLPAWTVVVALAPLAIVAGAGLRRPGRDEMERALLLWIAAGLITYFAVRAFPSHALAGLSLPFAVLAVRGWSRLRASVVAGAACVALAAVPGMAYMAREFDRVTDLVHDELYLSEDEIRALRHVESDAGDGGVLAPPLLALSVPAQTGRPVWVGHPSWTPDYLQRARAAELFFAGRLPPRRAAGFVRATGARVVVTACDSRVDPARTLGPLVARSRRFGCVSVHEVRR
jgi:hypothetical protein